MVAPIFGSYGGKRCGVVDFCTGGTENLVTHFVVRGEVSAVRRLGDFAISNCCFISTRSSNDRLMFGERRRGGS